MAALLVAFGYLAGSIPTGVLIANRVGIDLRRVGSGNIGATNVTRAAGTRLGLFTLLGDAMKGAIPTALATWLDVGAGVTATVAVAAVAGHVFPVMLGFRGGKGVATALGVLVVLAPLVAGAVTLVFALVEAASRWVSLGSLVATMLTPALLALLGAPTAHVLAMAAVAVLVVLRHRENLERLLEGSEPKIGPPTE